MGKRWQVQSKVDATVLEKFQPENPIIVQLLVNRGINETSEVEDFLNPDYDSHILDPFLFADMAKAVDRIFRAIKNKEKILIYGDYDADGVCATAILYSALIKLEANVDIRIPFREGEGYGLNLEAVKETIDNGFNLVITVDCGISNKEEVALFADSGVDVIITDHHQEPPELPDRAYAIINPALAKETYPFKKLCGAGVAFKVVQAMIRKQDEYNHSIKLPFGFDKWLLDLVAIATVGDIVPLVNENRIFVKYGLIVLEKTRRRGIMKIIEKVNHYSGKVDTQYIGWRLVPRINAAGRINHASLAFELITSDDEAEAEKLMTQLEEENNKRQSITAQMLKEAEAQVGEAGDQKIIWAIGDSWHPGVIGLVAGRLSDKYNLPALAVSRDGEKYLGSGRSIEGFDITNGLKQCEEWLEKFGGHPQACGFTVLGEDNFNKFKEKLTAIAAAKLADSESTPILEIDAEIELADIDFTLCEKLSQFEPFGENNPVPLFTVKNLKIEQVQTVGNEGKHLRAMVSQENHPIIHKIIAFSFGEWCAKLAIGDKIDIVFELGINEWNGNKELQLKVTDLKLSE